MANPESGEDETPETPPDGPESRDGTDGAADGRRECHRRGCSRQPAFRVTERYLEETGQGPVEATALLCQVHADEESPTNLDSAYEGYVFRVEPL